MAVIYPTKFSSAKKQDRWDAAIAAFDFSDWEIRGNYLFVIEHYGSPLHWWPSTGKWRYRHVTYYGNHEELGAWMGKSKPHWDTLVAGDDYGIEYS